jgi:hypothetical protein
LLRWEAEFRSQEELERQREEDTLERCVVEMKQNEKKMLELLLLVMKRWRCCPS